MMDKHDRLKAFDFPPALKLAIVLHRLLKQLHSLLFPAHNGTIPTNDNQSIRHF
jgi:hypothetical protein